MPLGLDLFLIIFFIVAHAFFSFAETSVLNVRKSRLREMIDDDDTPPKQIRKAKSILNLKSKVEDFLATVQTGSVFSGFIAATVSAVAAYNDLAPAIEGWLGTTPRTSLSIALISTILLVTVLDLTFGALIPKSIALHQSERVAFLCADVLRLISKVFRPFIRIPVLMSNLVLSPFRDRTSFAESRISEEEFRVMLEEGARSGAFDKTENELLENVFEFRERTVREVMVPRIKMVAIDVASPRESVIEQIVSEGYTRLPVYQGTIDNILGVIYSKDVLALIEYPDLIVLYDIIRPTPFVPETKLLAELLREFQHNKLHLAIVLDEFGGTAGLITLEDVVEEIVGEIQDEYDEDVPFVQIDEKARIAVLSANFSIGDANEHLEQLYEEFHIPDDEEYESVSGYVNKLFGYIPNAGESRETHGVRVTVVKREPSRVTQVRFEPSTVKQTPEEHS
jgi:CBS domain containing-hemolysin-like protein